MSREKEPLRREETLVLLSVGPLLIDALINALINALILLFLLANAPTVSSVVVMNAVIFGSCGQPWSLVVSRVSVTELAAHCVLPVLLPLKGYMVCSLVFWTTWAGWRGQQFQLPMHMSSLRLVY